MADFLFSCGVIVDDERPRQHKPAQVRCMDEELLPHVETPRRLCGRCKVSPATERTPHCAPCRRDMMCAAKGKAFKRRHAAAKALERLRTVGWLAKTKQNAVTVDELIREGYARIATARDRARHGVGDDRVIVVEASHG
jgi:hypothetical protein